MKDERNFHCWNYRHQMDMLYCQEIESRLHGSESTQDVKNGFLQQEADKARAIIAKNFANYSAWHYRGKLLPLIKQADSSVYALPLILIKEDLKSIKHAYFTDPKDQGPWNYHEWLLSLLSPIQVVAIRFLTETDGKVGLTIGLSHQVKNFAHLDISFVNGEGSPVEFEVKSAVPSRRSLSNSWSIWFSSSLVNTKDANSFTLALNKAKDG